MYNNYYILFLLLVLLFSLFIVKEVTKIKKNKKNNLPNNLYHLSLLFDNIYSDAKKKSNCSIEQHIIKNNKKLMKSYLNNLSQLLYSNPEIIIMNKNQCLKFNKNSNNSIIDNSNDSFCKDIWRQINNDIGFLLEYRLIKTYLNKNTIFLYKRYNCGNKDTQLIIGVSFKQM